MLGGLFLVGTAVATPAGFGRPEGSVAGIAVLEGVGGGWPRGEGRRKQGREAVGEETGRVDQVVGEGRGEGAEDGVGMSAAFQPGGDAGGEAVDVAFGEEKPGLVDAEAGEQVGGGAVRLGERLGERRRGWGLRG